MMHLTSQFQIFELPDFMIEVHALLVVLLCWSGVKRDEGVGVTLWSWPSLSPSCWDCSPKRDEFALRARCAE